MRSRRAKAAPKAVPEPAVHVFDAPLPIERLAAPPEKCPGCGRNNLTSLGWHHYRLIPGAPAAGCGKCGHVIYLEQDAYGEVRTRNRADLPKVAAGTHRFKKGA